MDEFQARIVVVRRSIKWSLLREIGVEDEVRSYFKREAKDELGNIKFTCNALDKELNIEEPIYQELVLEFVATYSFDENKSREDVQKDCMNFRLGENGSLYPMLIWQWH